MTTPGANAPFPSSSEEGAPKAGVVKASRIIMHLDMNSYFASVEQQANPFLRGRAVGVVATMTPNGCVIASSIEAKAKGIKVGVRARDARRIDPNVVLILNDAAKYRSCTAGMMKIFRQYTEDIELYSIDEAFLDLTGFVSDFPAAAKIADDIRHRIQTEVGDWLKCSIGIAPTRWLAKFAGDTAPKGQTQIIDHSNLATTLDPQPLTNAWGIAGRLEARLNTLGIYSLGDLRHYPVANIIQSFGVIGYELWANVNGLEYTAVQQSSQPKSIGHSHVFARRATSVDYPRAVLAKLCERAGRRLRQLDLEAYGIYLHYGLARQFNDYRRPSGGGAAPHHPVLGAARKLPVPLVDTRDIFNAGWKILTSLLPVGTLPNFLAVGMFYLKPRTDQLALWSHGKRDSPALAAALDQINDKYGDFTVARGNFWGLNERDVPDRIGFRKTAGIDA